MKHIVLWSLILFTENSVWVASAVKALCLCRTYPTLYFLVGLIRTRIRGGARSKVGPWCPLGQIWVLYYILKCNTPLRSQMYSKCNQMINTFKILWIAQLLRRGLQKRLDVVFTILQRIAVSQECSIQWRIWTIQSSKLWPTTWLPIIIHKWVANGTMTRNYGEKYTQMIVKGSILLHPNMHI